MMLKKLAMTCVCVWVCGVNARVVHIPNGSVFCRASFLVSYLPWTDRGVDLVNSSVSAHTHTHTHIHTPTYLPTGYVTAPPVG